MAEGNAEIVRRWIEVFNRGDLGAVVKDIGRTSWDGRPVRTEEFLDPDEARRRFGS
jgi:hypothetical protein